MSKNSRDVFVTHRMSGKRFEGHRVPVDTLADLAAYQALIIDLARTLFLHREKVEIRVVGMGLYDANDRLASITSVRDISTVDEGATNPDLDVKARLEQLASLGPGWLDGVGEAPDAEGLTWLAEFLHDAELTGLTRPHLYPTPEGGVQAEWSLPDAVEVSATFDLRGRRANLLGVYTRNGPPQRRSSTSRCPNQGPN
jgi:hypothetical protein